MSRKICVVLTGTNAVGKTTTRKVMWEHLSKEPGVEPEGWVDENDLTGEKTRWTLYKGRFVCFGVAGDHNSGTDSNCGPDKCIESARQVFAVTNICVLDGFMSSPRWCEIIHPLCIADFMLVYAWDFPLEEVVRRATKRRVGNNNSTPISDSTKQTFIKNMGKPKCFVRNVRLLLRPEQYEINTIGAEHVNSSPEQIATTIWKRIQELERNVV